MYGQKGTKKPPGACPRSPRHRPSGDTPFVVYLRSDQTGLILPAVPALRLPLPIVYPRVLTIGEAAGECGANLLRIDSEGPRCWLYPFKRPAGVQWPTATSNPKPPVAAHGRSWMRARPLDQNPVGNSCSRGTAALCLQVCPKVRRRGGRPNGTAPSKGVQNRRFWRAFGHFSRVGKVTAGRGAA